MLLVGLASASIAFADQPTPGNWHPGPDASGANTYIGVVQSPSSKDRQVSGDPFQVSGWVVDSTAQGWGGIDAVEVYQGFRDQGGKLLSKAQIAQPRKDVWESTGNPYWYQSGFTASVAQAPTDLGTSPITIYAHTPAKGWWWTQVDLNVIRAPNTGPKRNWPAIELGFLLVAQVAALPLLAAAVPVLRRAYLSRWVPALAVQLLIAAAGLTYVAVQPPA